MSAIPFCSPGLVELDWPTSVKASTAVWHSLREVYLKKHCRSYRVQHVAQLNHQDGCMLRLVHLWGQQQSQMMGNISSTSRRKARDHRLLMSQLQHLCNRNTRESHGWPNALFVSMLFGIVVCCTTLCRCSCDFDVDKQTHRFDLRVATHLA